MKKLLAFYLLVLLSPIVLAQDVAIFEKNNLFGLKDAKNKVIVKASYDYMYPLKDNYFLVEKERKIGLLTKTGRVVFPPQYDDVQDFGDSFFMVLQNNKWGIIDMLNKTVLPCEYSGIEQFNDYLYLIRSGDKKGLMTKYATVIAAPKYDEITSLPKNLLKVKSGTNVGIIDDMGKVIIPDTYQSLEKLPACNLYCVGKSNKFGIIDLSGKVIAEPVLDEVDALQTGFVTVKKDGKYGFIINQKYIPATYDRIVFAQQDLGVIVVRQGNLNGFVTIYGQVTPPIYENISRFSANGHAFVERNGKLMFVDLYGKEKTLQEVAGRGSL